MARRLAQAGRAKVLAEFTWEKVAQGLGAIYREAGA